MNEVELKILEVNVEEITQKLLDLGAKKVFEGEVDAVYFDTKDDYFFNNNQQLRVRKKGDQVELCYKKGTGKTFATSADETEVNVSDFDSTLKIFESIGYLIKGRESKTRVSYRLDNIMYEFNTLRQIPTFLEIESTSEEQVKKGVELIGYKIEDTITMHTGELLKHYNEKGIINPQSQ